LSKPGMHDAAPTPGYREVSGDGIMAGVNSYPLTGEASLSGARRRIRAALDRAGADPSLSFDCLVAVTEACTTALGHGGADGRTPVVTWTIDGDRASFCIRDYASREWARGHHPARGARVPGGAPEPGGFGLDLMRGLMDEVVFEVTPEGASVSLVKLIS